MDGLLGVVLVGFAVGGISYLFVVLLGELLKRLGGNSSSQKEVTICSACGDRIATNPPLCTRCRAKKEKSDLPSWPRTPQEDNVARGMSYEIAMYDMWLGFNYGHNSMLTSDDPEDVTQLKDIIVRILKCEGVPYHEKTVFMIEMMVLQTDITQLLEIYREQNFEAQGPAFCRSIGILPPY